MKKLDSKDPIKTKNKDLISLTIISVITMIILFLESIYILIKGFGRGIMKKEVLSKKSNLGFDLEIRLKS